MKIYTRTGDKGTTALIGGKRVEKFHERIEAYGTVDELIAHIALLHDSLEVAEIKAFLITVTERLMCCASILAADCEDCKVKIPRLTQNDVAAIEQQIDAMQDKLPELRSFILPGGDKVSSVCHVARTVCRRAERCAVKLAAKSTVPEEVLLYLNRLSDYLFVLARYILHLKNKPEIPWVSRLEN
jgi:cob(I)alamin adenosyltransferase